MNTVNLTPEERERIAYISGSLIPIYTPDEMAENEVGIAFMDAATNHQGIDMPEDLEERLNAYNLLVEQRDKTKACLESLATYMAVKVGRWTIAEVNALAKVVKNLAEAPETFHDVRAFDREVDAAAGKR